MEVSPEQPAVDDNFIGGYILGKIFFSFVETLCAPQPPLQKYFQNGKTEKHISLSKSIFKTKR